MKLDALFIASHPDDIEITSAGTAISLVKTGRKVGIIDLTRGELSTRGTLKTRAEETKNAAEVMGIHYRSNLGLKDGSIENSEKNRLKLIKEIRKLKPSLVFAPYPSDRHPDHINAGNFVRESCFFSGLKKIKTGKLGAYRPDRIFFYRHAYDFPVSFIVDISDTFHKKIEAIKCYKTQFYKESGTSGDEPETYISSKLFWQDLETRARFYGFKIGTEFGEPFFCYESIRADSDMIFKI